MTERAREKRQRLLDALRGAQLLHEQGLDHLIPGMLMPIGFDSLEQLQSALLAADLDARTGQTSVAEERPVDSGAATNETDKSRIERPAANGAAGGGDSAGIGVLPHPGTDADEAYLELNADDEPLQFPWDLGTPPLLASLISERRMALAVCVASAAGETPIRQRVLRFFCAAFSCAPAVLELQLPELLPPDAEFKEADVDECRVFLAAALRAGLVLGYTPAGLPSLIERAELGRDSRAIAEAAAEAISRGYRRETGPSDKDYSDLPREWATFKTAADRLRETLGMRKLPLQRASNVLHYIVRQDQPVGQALTLVAELAAQGVGAAAAQSQNQGWSPVEIIAADLCDSAKRARLIAAADQAVSTNSQLRKPIIAVARARLDAALCEVGEFLAEFLAVRSAIRLSSRPANLEMAEELFRAIEQQPSRVGVASVGDAAWQQLSDWLQAATAAATFASIEDLISIELEPLYEIPRDENGDPLRAPNLTEISQLLGGRDPLTVVRGYLGVGNVSAARHIIAATDGINSAALDDEVLIGARNGQNRHQQGLEAVDHIAARLRAVYEDEAALSLTARAESLRTVPDGRFDLTIGPLHDLANEGIARLTTFRDGLRQRALVTACDGIVKQRILQLIDHEDEILAVEFLTMAEADLPLPEVEEQHGDDFSDFFPAMVNAALTASRAGNDVVDAVRAAAGATAAPVNRQLAAGLEAWRELQADKRASNDRFRLCVAEVLRMLGLVPRSQYWLQELSKTQRSGFATFKVRATPLDRSYVPSFGTQAHDTYDLTLVWDLVTPIRLMDFIEERRRTEANIILYFNTLEPAQRLMLRRLTSPDGGKGFSPLVIDEPVIAWLSTRPEPGWRFAQRVTLPFTTINPYTPFAGGEVPDEVFVGRESERQAIESPTGSMFVYGGRQLGKSALLRRVERLFTEPPPAQLNGSWRARTGHVAVYQDLKAASIGEAQEPAALWTVLANRLKDAQVLSPKTGRGIGPDEVTRQLFQWLAEDDANRLLLLLDEADNFLTADSQAGRTGTGTGFPTLQRLKGLMEDSGRRFKAVFAGLHKVQRFHDSSNTPVAHGGDDILIGPLRSMDAYRLVVDPMNALGYKFSSPELVWRLLLFTNYQASLVQIVCEALVRELRRRQLPEGGGRISVSSEDVEAVYAKREVRDLIVQRFRWTINLDNRYRVIALVVALQSLDSDPGETFTPEELHEYCAVYWPAGFSSGVLTSKEFRRYLEEMVGLGVLHRQGEQYGLRSPNIIGMLGTRQSLDQELDEVPTHLELEYEYNPTMNRRIVGQSTELWAPRSPLTDQDIASLLGQVGALTGRVQIVTGSLALTIDRAARVIEDVADEKRIPCTIVRADDVDSVIAGARVRRHVIVDLSGGDDGPAVDLSILCDRLAARRQITATVIVGPAALPLPKELVSPGDVTPIRRWSIEGLRSWHESPFDTPGLRKRLHRVTSGWPRLVEETMREIVNGKAPEDALEWVVKQLTDPAFAHHHLVRCGIDPAVARRWAVSQAVTGDDGLVEAFPASLGEIAEILETDPSEVIEKLKALDVVEPTQDGWVLDRAILAAAMALRE
jgi:hypothetical protein